MLISWIGLVGLDGLVPGCVLVEVSWVGLVGLDGFVPGCVPVEVSWVGLVGLDGLERHVLNLYNV